MLRRVKVYLDIDGVLLGADPDKSHRVTLANHALEFLQFAVANFDVYWLAPQCRADAKAAVDHLVRHAKLSDRERLMDVAGKVKATNWSKLRTEALPAAGEFVWMDDEPDVAEMADLRQRRLLDRWLWVDTREEPEDLVRARKWLEGRLARGEMRAGEG